MSREAFLRAIRSTFSLRPELSRVFKLPQSAQREFIVSDKAVMWLACSLRFAWTMAPCWNICPMLSFHSPARASFIQSTAVSLGLNAGFIGWETLAAGRIASGEEFGFDFFHSEYNVSSDTRPLALERYSLSPSARDPRSVARWGRFRYSATLYICHTGVAQPRWIELESRLNDIAFLQTSHAERWGVSTLLAGGLVIRGLALEAHRITTRLYTFWDLAKQELWGEPAIPPRKIN
jgi:urease accessory protein